LALVKNKGKVQYLLSRFLHETDSCIGALHNLESTIWLAWAHDTAAHYALANNLTRGLQQADIPPSQSAVLGFHPVAITHFPFHGG